MLDPQSAMASRSGTQIPHAKRVENGEVVIHSRLAADDAVLMRSLLGPDETPNALVKRLIREKAARKQGVQKNRQAKTK